MVRTEPTGQCIAQDIYEFTFYSERVIRVLFPVKVGATFINCAFETRACSFPTDTVETAFADVSISDGTNRHYGSLVYKV